MEGEGLLLLSGISFMSPESLVNMTGWACPLKLKTEDLDTTNVTGICKHCLIHLTAVSGHVTEI